MIKSNEESQDSKMKRWKKAERFVNSPEAWDEVNGNCFCKVCKGLFHYDGGRGVMLHSDGSSNCLDKNGKRRNGKVYPMGWNWGRNGKVETFPLRG